jgi:dihydrofolate synthase/folylpolyglutamate synthase
VTIRFQRRLETLYGLERHKEKLGLEGTRALLEALGDPQTRFRSVHVAGTNGKGSVCALVERVLREAGYRTGLFTSPHLVDFRERIRVNGRWVDEVWLDAQLEKIDALPEGQDRTFFEVCTALAFSYFAERKVEIAVVEVGLGGRLDCTNVITPEVSVITSIGLDHTEVLGDTIEEIAREKAGVIKPGVPIVVEEDIDPAARGVIEEIAARAGAPLRRDDARSRALIIGDDRGRRAESILVDTAWDNLVLESGSYAELFSHHAATAVRALGVLHEGEFPLPPSAVQRGLAHARWPGRFERCPTQPRLWWDGAHNLDGMRWHVVNWMVARLRPPAAIALALSRDKDVGGILDFLRDGYPQTRLIATRTRSERAREPRDLAELAAARGMRVETAPDVRAAVDRALETPGDEPVLLIGSLFAVGEAMEAFGGAPGEQL